MLLQDILCETIDSLAAKDKILDVIQPSSLDNLQYYLVREAEESSHDGCLVERDGRE